MKKNCIELVKHRSWYYPKAERDYEILASLGYPINKVPLDFLPVLRSSLPAKMTTKIVNFAEMEADMLVRFKQRWQRDVEISEKNILLTGDPDTPDSRVEKATDALKKWYRGHYIGLEFVTKRTSKTLKIVSVKKFNL
jgi:hypothetical protein